MQTGIILLNRPESNRNTDRNEKYAPREQTGIKPELFHREKITRTREIGRHHHQGRGRGRVALSPDARAYPRSLQVRSLSRTRFKSGSKYSSEVGQKRFSIRFRLRVTQRTAFEPLSKRVHRVGGRRRQSPEHGKNGRGGLLVTIQISIFGYVYGNDLLDRKLPYRIQ